MPLLLLRGNPYMTTSCKLASLACSATASRLQLCQPLETTRPHDNTPTGRRSPGLFVRFRSLIRAPAQGWQGGTCCGMLDSMIQYNRPRRRDEVADFVAASGRRLYVFAAVRLALCSRLPISSGISSAQARATADAGQMRRGRGRAGGEDAREHAGHEQGTSRRRGEASPRADARRGWGGL